MRASERQSRETVPPACPWAWLGVPFHAAQGRAGPERHPERRAKAAYRAFEDREMPKLRADFPSLKRSQLKERLWKVWQKSDENPLNQETAAYNAKPASAAAASAAAAGDA